MIGIITTKAAMMNPISPESRNDLTGGEVCTYSGDETDHSCSSVKLFCCFVHCVSSVNVFVKITSGSEDTKEEITCNSVGDKTRDNTHHSPTTIISLGVLLG
tara:strand:+ start:1904 stop:2209 length:306 start_codon:yes stop_codon:yes gene_type:complete